MTVVGGAGDAELRAAQILVEAEKQAFDDLRAQLPAGAAVAVPARIAEAF